ncbi:DUF3841 domain-containing protein [Sinomonas gamaensis]|uniref:DUF3841 domain-containing protein n=1 Tax=Sinomonas gamaensis TaxID=2565624 RepID=UPI0014866B79|nr:DUF3841 domain-containing protein [Sinomonas gamaensis]
MTFPIRSARRGDAVPPGRIGYDTTAPVLLLHTVQTEEALQELLDTGRLNPDPARAMEGYDDAYAWLLSHMEKRLPTRGNGMVWLWAKIRRDDLIHNIRYSDGKVLLTCRIPRERVLLSQYDDWHQVLNESPNILSLPGETPDEYEVRIEGIYDDLHARLKAAGAHRVPISAWPEELRLEVESSWEAIFDPANYTRRRYWQATVHELLAEDVVEAVRLES